MAMKQLIILLLITIVITMKMQAQNFNRIIFDEKAEQEILIGNCTKNTFTIEPFNEWYQIEYDTYIVDSETLLSINPEIIADVKIKLILGTWCEDSQREFPRFIKILEELNIDENQLKIICVNRGKEVDSFSIDDLKVDLVPTIIFYFEDNEIGRITESPNESLEKDLIKIISNI